MSVEIVLIPLAIAAIGAWQASRQESDAKGLTVCHVQTRMRDEGLLEGALTDTQAQVSHDGAVLTANWRGVRADFRRDEQGIWQVSFTGTIEAAGASAIVAEIDRAYGRRVQQAVLIRLRERASSAGMSVDSETVEDDSSVTMVLNVQQGR